MMRLSVYNGLRFILPCLLIAIGLALLVMEHSADYSGIIQKMLNTTQIKDPHQISAVSEDSLQVDFRRRLANKISKIQLEIARSKESGSDVIDSKWSVGLSEVVAELDPRAWTLSGSSSEKWDFSARLPGMESAPKTTPDGCPRNVCPEIFIFNRDKNAPYYQKGMTQENCSYVPMFKSILTVLLVSKSWKYDDLTVNVKRILRYYDMKIIGIVNNSSNFNNYTHKNLIFLEKNIMESDSEALTRAIKLIKTPFILFGKSLNNFNNQSSLERLIRVLDELPLVKVAAGAARDSEGKWIHGCLQQKMENYHAKYDQGYYSSKYECMYCDDVLTPFVTYTELFEQVNLTKGLNGPIVFHDWFVRLRHAGHLSVTCPDVMFYVSEHPVMTTSDWRRFAQIWSLTKIKSYNDTILEFSCSEANISCKGIRTLVKSFLIPPCCLDNIQDELNIILDFADENNLQYELQSGSVLAAVKMGRHLPWDFDMDFTFSCGDYDKWMKIRMKLLTKKCSMSIIKRGEYFIIHCNSLMYEVICKTFATHHLSRDTMPEELINIETKINFGGRWTSAISNPGLWSRNRYGMKDLRHVNHWRFLTKNPAHEIGQYFYPGTWNRCTQPNHHACIDRFPGDGNLPFDNLL